MEHFCTCTAKSCSHHPANHESGCDLCIAKNLARREIPACFFLKVSPDVEGLSEYTFESFVNFFIKHTSLFTQNSVK